MYIVSQDKQTLVSTENINYIEAEEKERHYKDYIYTITAYFNNNHKLLGKYNTANRVKEIIQDMYKQLMIQNFSFTYEMPKE